MGHDIPAVVLDLSATGIGIVRSLAEKGIHVYAFDTTGKYEIGKTLYATCGICPNPVSEEEELLQYLISVAGKFVQKAVLFAGSDDFVQQQEGIKWVYLVRDFLSFRQKQRNREMTLLEWIKSLSGKKVDALFNWNDPLSFIGSFVSHLRNLWDRQ